MRYTTHAGIALLIIAAVMLIASSGAFESVEADRGVSVQTVSDEEAYLGLEYDETIELVPSMRDEQVCGNWNLICYNRYNNVVLLEISDNTPSSQLTELQLTAEDPSGFSPFLRDSYIYDDIQEVGDFIGIRADISCSAFGGTQDESEGQMTVSASSSGSDIGIDAPDRIINIQCTGG